MLDRHGNCLFSVFPTSDTDIYMAWLLYSDTDTEIACCLYFRLEIYKRWSVICNHFFIQYEGEKCWTLGGHFDVAQTSDLRRKKRSNCTWEWRGNISGGTGERSMEKWQDEVNIFISLGQVLLATSVPSSFAARKLVWLYSTVLDYLDDNLKEKRVCI